MKKGYKIHPFILVFLFNLTLLLGQQTSSYLTQKLMVENGLRERIGDALSKVIDDQKYVIDVDVDIEITGEKEEQITIIPGDRPIYDEASALEQLTTIIGEAAPGDGSGKDRLENGHYILTVGQHYVLIVDQDSVEQALISMSSSQGKISRGWNSMMLSITFDGKNGAYNPSCFSHSYKLSSVLNSGKGNQWYGYNVVQVGKVEDPALYERAKKFYTSLASK